MPEVKVEGTEEYGWDIVFAPQGVEVIRISPRGFFYKGGLVEDPEKVYRRFAEFMGLAETELEARVRDERQGRMGQDGTVTVPGQDGYASDILPAPVQEIPLDQVGSEDIKTDLLIIQASQTGDDKLPWLNLSPTDLPAWVAAPEAVGDMRQGTKIRHNDGGLWFRAVRVKPDVH